jgi:hypothetical protein
MDLVLLSGQMSLNRKRTPSPELTVPLTAAEADQTGQSGLPTGTSGLPSFKHELPTLIRFV